MKTIGLIGAGYWGSNYLRIFDSLPECDLKWCADLDPERLERVSELYPEVRITDDIGDLVDDQDVDAVCVATPPSTHFDIAEQFIKAGVDLLIEKPLTLDGDSAWELADLATEHDRIILVGHVYEYHSAVQELASRLDEFGDILHIGSRRMALGPVRRSINALWDLCPHDVSIFNHLIDSRPTSVSCFGQSYLTDSEDVVYLAVKYANGVVASAHASWCHPVKERMTTVVGSDKMAAFDDVNPEQMLRIFDHDVTVDPSSGIRVTEGDVVIPQFEQKEPLKEQARHFLRAVESREQPLTGGASGARVVDVLEAATESLSNGGQEIDVPNRGARADD